MAAGQRAEPDPDPNPDPSEDLFFSECTYAFLMHIHVKTASSPLWEYVNDQ